VDDDQCDVRSGEADRRPTFFTVFVSIRRASTQWILENALGDFEAHAVLAIIRPVLAFVPFESHCGCPYG
jgi:hypothetical protein